jgi:hypothetical protein
LTLRRPSGPSCAIARCLVFRSTSIHSTYTVRRTQYRLNTTAKPALHEYRDLHSLYTQRQDETYYPRHQGASGKLCTYRVTVMNVRAKLIIRSPSTWLAVSRASHLHLRSPTSCSVCPPAAAPYRSTGDLWRCTKRARSRSRWIALYTRLTGTERCQLQHGRVRGDPERPPRVLSHLHVQALLLTYRH